MQSHLKMQYSLPPAHLRNEVVRGKLDQMAGALVEWPRSAQRLSQVPKRIGYIPLLFLNAEAVLRYTRTIKAAFATPLSLIGLRAPADLAARKHLRKGAP